jgi:hypothetical protein
LYALTLHRGDFMLLAITVGVLALAIYVRLFVQVPTLSQFF